MKSRISRLSLAISVLFNAILLLVLWHGAGVRDSRADQGAPEELAPYMAMMQHLSHKLGLAVQAKNQPLAAFYLEEVEEASDIIKQKFPTYDKFEIGKLVDAMFVPAIEPLEKSINAKSWAVATAGYTRLVDSCNGCHAATAHPFVKITAPTANPFSQTFSPQ